MPSELIAHHINAIQAIVRERTKLDTISMASELSRRLRGVADEYLARVNRDRSVCCVVITGAGESFSSGGNVKAMRDRGLNPRGVSAR